VTVGEALAHGTHVLAEAGIDTARLESELLLAKACDDCPRALLYMELRRELSPEERERFEALLARRAQREPLAYVLGHWGFRRLTLKTDKRALVPRPETEIVVERALEHLDGLPAPRVLDVGTGTGAIALAIVDEHPGASVTAIDVSRDALALARENLDLIGINGRVRLVEHDLMAGFGRDDFDLVVSNPPYVEPGDVETLQPEIRDWEPRIALVAHGATEAVARAATEALCPGGWIVLEIAENQAANVARLLGELGYDDLRISPDMAGRDRVLEGRWNR
jgi:release factor glutamine methyltransferase